MAAPNDKSSFHVLVIGAGSVGLLIAQRLQSLGIKCTVFEREQYLNERSRDWSYGVYWAQNWLKECLTDSLHGKLTTAQVDPTRFPSPDDTIRIMNGKTAEEFVTLPVPNLYRLRRSKFRILLAEGVNVQVVHPPYQNERRTLFAIYLPNFSCSMVRSSGAFPIIWTAEMQRSRQLLKTTPKLQAIY